MVSREDQITQSVEDYVRYQLFTRFSYPPAKVELLDAFPYHRLTETIDKTYIAVGFNFDDGGEQAELGSDLKRRQHTIEFFIFGHTGNWGSNVASTIRTAIDSDGTIPLKDVGGSGAVIDSLPVLSARKERVPARDPRPWEEHVYLVRLRVEDEYNAALLS